MKLSKKAIRKIDKRVKLELAIALKFTEYWIGKLLEKNKSNGPLTTPSALQVIREFTGLNDDQILEEDAVKA